MAPSSLFAAIAISMKPACETDEYASRRFRFRCTSAARFPTASETHASTAIAIVQRCSCSGKATTRIRSVRTSAATFVAAAMNAVTEVGAPS